MSTSICKPLDFGILSKTPETVLDRRMLWRSDCRKVKRVLFEPVDHDATQRFLDKELEKISVHQSSHWNFDFRNEKQLNDNGRFNWKQATPQKTFRVIKHNVLDDQEIEELYAEPSKIIRPEPRKFVHTDDNKNNNNNNVNKNHQTLMTDFLRSTKRATTSCEGKKQSDRPVKIPRLDVEEYS